VVDGTGLENRQGRKSFGGSNPSLSAIWAQEVRKMSTYSKGEWQSYSREKPPKGTRLLLRMVDSSNDISYAIGITDVETGKLWLSAREKTESDPIEWMLIPD
jgi:hypothetical protein